MADLGLLFYGDSGPGVDRGLNLEMYVDAEYASKAADRCSVLGAVILCGGASVTWIPSTQTCVTLSTTEAECVAMGDGAKEALCVRGAWFRTTG